MSDRVATVPQMSEPRGVEEFFGRYARALLDRDEQSVAQMYAVPGLILFPGQSLPVTDTAQTEAFFAASWSQYDGVSSATPNIEILAGTGHSVWVDVTWYHDGEPRERFVYQLVGGPDDEWQIAVLTPLDLG